MISPYTQGPMGVTGFTWYQGEANTANQASADAYACIFPSMITAWRNVFQVPNAYFGFVQLSTWCPADSQSIPQMRQAQLEALNLDSMVAYSTNADHGAACNIHPLVVVFFSCLLNFIANLFILLFFYIFQQTTKTVLWYSIGKFCTEPCLQRKYSLEKPVV